jgi:hypothetical protein
MNMGLTDYELAREFERRNPYECYITCVEMGIGEIIAKLREIELSPPSPPPSSPASPSPPSPSQQGEKSER